MKNSGLSEAHTKFVSKSLGRLQAYCNLDDPEKVKNFIACLNVSNGYKKNLVMAYAHYCKHYEIEWDKPRYYQEAKPRRIPTTAQLDMLIAHAKRTMATKLTLSKETGLRPIEICRLEVRDIDLEQRTVYPTTAKHGAPRKLKISSNLTTLIKAHIDKHNLQPADKLFKGDSENYGKYYRQSRNNLADKLNKPELRTIQLYDFRHYYATKLYSKTRDILLVKRQLGHRKIETTLIYTKLLDLEDDEWTCKIASNVKQSTELIEEGFEYVTEQDGLKLFRKRK